MKQPLAELTFKNLGKPSTPSKSQAHLTHEKRKNRNHGANSTLP